MAISSTKKLIFSLASLLVFAAPGMSQEDKAVLTGIITDSTQAVVPGAIIEIANSANGFSRISKSNETGSYTIGGLPIGAYQVTISDHRISDDTSFLARYNLDNALLTSPSGNLLDVSRTPSYPMSGTIQLLHTFSSSMFNETQLGFNRIKAKTVIDSRLFDISHLNESLSVAGFSPLGQARQSISTPTSYSAPDNWNLTKGQHTIKSGIEIRRVLFNQDNAPTRCSLW